MREMHRSRKPGQSNEDFERDFDDACRKFDDEARERRITEEAERRRGWWDRQYARCGWREITINAARAILAFLIVVAALAFIAGCESIPDTGPAGPPLAVPYLLPGPPAIDVGGYIIESDAYVVGGYFIRGDR